MDNIEFCKGKEPIVVCPHCKDPALIQKMNCAIFRHGIRKFDGIQMDPHAPKDVCDRLVKDNAIYGCGKPFRVQIDLSGIMVAVECDYI